MARTHYEVLGVARNATELEVKNAYRVLAKRYHPDVCTEPNADTKFKEVQDAYMVLSDQRKRLNYDAELLSREASGRPADEYDMMLQRFGIGAAIPKKKKKPAQPKKKRQKKANVFVDDLPDGTVPDDSLGGII